MKPSHLRTLLVTTAMLAGSAQAQETLKVLGGIQGGWPTSFAELGEKSGIFAKHGLHLDILYSQGGGESIQAVLTGSVDIGVGIGTAGAMGVFQKGAPIRIIGATTTGASDILWYVPSQSAIQSLRDAAGKTFAFSSRGSSTQMVGHALLDQNSVKALMVATGGMSATLTSTLSGQIDIGWTAAPVGIDALLDKKIRIIATGDDAEQYRNQTVRVIVATAALVKDRSAALNRFIAAYKETIDWLYADDRAIEQMARITGFSNEIMVETRKVYTRESVDMFRITGLDGVMRDGVTTKVMSSPLSDEQLSALITIPYSK
jgi:NitT/TauT family transport system substrate-binding protein